MDKITFFGPATWLPESEFKSMSVDALTEYAVELYAKSIRPYIARIKADLEEQDNG